MQFFCLKVYKLIQTGFSVLHEEGNELRHVDQLEKSMELLAKTATNMPFLMGITNLSSYVKINTLKFVAHYTLPTCPHRRGYVPFDRLFSTLTQSLKDILAFFETNSTRGDVKFLPVLMNAMTGPAKDEAAFIGGVNIVTAILDEDWPCRECFPEETILSHLAKLTGSFLCWRLCTYITLTAAISSNPSTSSNGVKALERLIPILAKQGTLKGQFLHEFNVALLPTFIRSGRPVILRLMPIFRLLHQLSDSREMELSVKVCLGFTTSPTLNNWTYNGNKYIHGKFQCANTANR